MTQAPRPAVKLSFLEELRQQRWDDHRYYHQSRVNQSLHFFSACTFVGVYILLFFDPAKAAIIGWFVSMLSRQTGHFFFEPTEYDHVNGASNEYKEAIKTGYNLNRKVILLSAWCALPALLWLSPTALGLLPDQGGFDGWVERVGLAWLYLAIFALLARTAYLAATQSVQTGLAWCTKILTDPYNDIKLYHKSPLYLLQGQKLDPMTHG
jgi:hypothetical protein